MEEITDEKIEQLFKTLRETAGKKEREAIRKKILKMAFEIRRRAIADKKQPGGI